MIKRKDFLFLFDVQDGNPNGDPDAGNLPRIDPGTNQGIVTDGCLKRKIRNRVQIALGPKEGYLIYVTEGAILNQKYAEAYEAINQQAHIKLKKGIKEPGENRTLEKANQVKDAAAKARQEMCRRYYDLRTFGGVLTADTANSGQVRGPVQMTFSRSIDPIVQAEHAITRMAVATEAESIKQGGGNRTMGRKYTVPYGLYLGRGFLNPHFAEQTGFSEADEELFFESLKNMFESDRSSARGFMALRKLIIFTHDSPLGNAPAHRLFDRVKVSRKSPDKEPTCYDDYEIKINADNRPSGVSIEVWPEESAEEESVSTGTPSDESLAAVLA